MESFVLLIFRVDLLPRLDFSAGVDNSILNWISNELENFWIFPSRMISDVPTVISKAKNHKITFAFSMRFFTLVDIGKKCSLFFLREIPSPFLGLLGFSRLLGIGYFAKLAPNCVLAWCWEDKMVMFHYIHRGQSIRGTKQQDHPSYTSSDGTSHSKQAGAHCSKINVNWECQIAGLESTTHISHFKLWNVNFQLLKMGWWGKWSIIHTMMLNLFLNKIGKDWGHKVSFWQLFFILSQCYQCDR